MLRINKQTDRQTDKQTDSKSLPTPTVIVGVGNKYITKLELEVRNKTAGNRYRKKLLR